MRQIRGGGVNTCDSDGSVPIEEFKELYVKESALYETKSGSFSTTPLFFHYNKLTVDWTRFIRSFSISTNNKRIFVDVMAEDGEGHFLVMRDGQGLFLSKCFTGVRVVQSLKTFRTAVYHRVLIPEREIMERYDNSEFDDGVLLACNLESINYSGLEVFTSIEGKIVGMNRYFEGELAESPYYNNGYSDWNSLRVWFGAYVVRGFVLKKSESLITKTATGTGSGYICPECSAEVTKYEDGHYECSSCSWNSLTSMDGIVEEAIVIADRGNNKDNNGESDDSDSSDDDCEQPVESNDNDGSGGAGGYSDNGTYLNFHLDSRADSYIKPVLDKLETDCIGKAVIDNIGDMGVSFKQYPLVSSLACYLERTNTIYYYTSYPETIPGKADSVGDPLIILEEMMHALQVKNGCYNTSYGLNNEIEAKMAVYIYAEANGMKEKLRTHESGWKKWEATFGEYLKKPTDENYKLLIDFVKKEQDYSNDPNGKFGESESHRNFSTIVPMIITPCSSSKGAASKKTYGKIAEKLIEANS